MRGLLNSRIFLGAAFVGLSAIAATMLIVGPPKADVPASMPASKPSAGGVVPPAQVAAAPTPAPAAPVDERFVIKRVLPITGPIKYGE